MALALSSPRRPSPVSTLAGPTPPEVGCEGHGNAALADDLARAGALAHHAENRAFVDSLLGELLALPESEDGAFTDDDLARNAAEWVVAHEVELVVLSPTHDSAARAQPGHVRCFDRRRTWDEEGADYGDGEAGILEVFANQSGVLLDGELLLVDPLRRPGSVRDTLVHEVQHDADGHERRERPAPDPGAIEACPAFRFAAFESEFRAHWLSRDAELPSPDAAPSGVLPLAARDRSGTLHQATMTFANARQERLLRLMCGVVPADGNLRDPQGGWITLYAWLAYYYVLDPAFRAVVDGTTRLSSVNGLDSVRIERLRRAVAEGTWSRAAAALDDHDRAWLLDPVASVAFWDEARTHLAPGELSALRLAVSAW